MRAPPHLRLIERAGPHPALGRARLALGRGVAALAMAPIIDGVAGTHHDVAEIVTKACHSTSQIEFAPRRPWDRSIRREADISKAKSVLGFQPTVGIREGVERTVDWFRANLDRIAAAMVTRG